MEENNKEVDNAIVQDDSLYNRGIVSKPKPKIDMDIERTNSVVDEMLGVADSSQIDMGVLNSFLDVSRGRDQQYRIIDQMCQDSIPSAILELYSEDSTATNDNKDVVWATSDDPEVLKTTSYYLDCLQVNKHIYKWASAMIKYGDIYLKTFRQSELENDPIFKGDKNKTKGVLNESKDSLPKTSPLTEDVNVHLNPESDPLALYVEMVDNPATVFELTRFGKTAGFIQTHIESGAENPVSSGSLMTNSFGGSFYQYKFRKNDIDVYEASQFVHGSLDDNVDRVTEEVQIIIDDDTNTNSAEKKEKAVNYKVRSGQSVFYNTFKIWRELSLLETSLILNRLTKSSITRVIQVETGNTAKEETGQILQSVKQLIEQKAALNPGSSMAEYNNPGPIENNIYVPTHDGKGAITTAQIGGDYDPKQLTDLDYFKNKFYGSLGAPKQFFGDTDDGAGFNGGQSLTIISSKYAKKVLKIQSALIQMITSLINLIHIDRGLSTYVNKFTIHMLPPMTQEDIDRKDAEVNQLGIIRDTMDLLSDIEDRSVKLKILKELLAKALNNPNVIDILDQEINKLENGEGDGNESKGKDDMGREESSLSSRRDTTPLGLDNSLDLDTALDLDNTAEEETVGEESVGETNNDVLPTPGETGVDLVNGI